MTEKNNKSEKTISKSTLKKLKEKVDILIDNGSSLEHAISVVSSVNGYNPKTITSLLNKVYNYEEKDSKKEYKDIKNDEGSYVMLKKNPGKDYEVINIINKDNIVISDLDDNTELKVKEEDIIPIVTETKMNKKLNEAQYTVSIDNLETTDAETLSQMLSLAGQAEQPVATEMPMDTMAEPAPVMDYEPTIPSTMDGPGFEAAEIDPMAEPAPSEEMPVVDAEEDVVLPAEETEIVGESLEEGCVKEDVLVPSSEKDEKEDPTTAEEDAGDSMFEKCKKIIDDIKEEVGDDADNVSNKVFALKEMGNLSDEEYDYIVEHFDELCECGLAEEKYEYTPEEEKELKDDVKWEKYYDAKDIESEKEYDEPKEETDESFDAEIAEALRNAGVQLNEDTYGELTSEEVDAGKEDLPTPPVGKANPGSSEDAKGQEPDWEEVSTEDAMGYDATTGFEPLPNIKVEETVNKSKIDSIMETARRMYAKKDSSEWLALDRRYISKLMLEGVGYSNASKMLMQAKAGK